MTMSAKELKINAWMMANSISKNFLQCFFIFFDEVVKERFLIPLKSNNFQETADEK